MRKDGISWLHFTVSSHISSLRRMEAWLQLGQTTSKSSITPYV
jgi:hypothetical protein